MNDITPTRTSYLSKGTGVKLLLLSLLVNCFLLGLSVAPMLRKHEDHLPPPLRNDMVEHLSEGLPPADAAQVQQSYQQQKQLFDQSRKGIETSMQAASAALQAKPFDPAALHKALKDIAVSHDQFSTAMTQFFDDVAAHMSPEGRHMLAQNGLRPPPHGDHGPGPDHDRDHGHDHGPDDGPGHDGPPPPRD